MWLTIGLGEESQTRCHWASPRAHRRQRCREEVVELGKSTYYCRWKVSPLLGSLITSATPYANQYPATQLHPHSLLCSSFSLLIQNINANSAKKQIPLSQKGFILVELRNQFWKASSTKGCASTTLSHFHLNE